MTDLTYPVLEDWKKNTHCTNETYLAMYEKSIRDPEGFWDEIAGRIDWFKPYTRVKDTRLNGRVDIKWFVDGKLNVSYNCLDRHLEKRGDQIAIIYEGDDPEDIERITYRDLHERDHHLHR